MGILTGARGTPLWRDLQTESERRSFSPTGDGKGDRIIHARRGDMPRPLLEGVVTAPVAAFSANVTEGDALLTVCVRR